MKKILFVLSNINIGGPQKSMLGLLDMLDYSAVDVSVLVLEPGGILENYFNPQVKFLPVDPLVTAATIPAKHTMHHLWIFLRKAKYKMFFSAMLSILKFFVFHNNMNQERQKFWIKYHSQLPLLNTQSFDMAFGVMAGLTTYYIIDCVNATQKYHWIRSDYRILNLNREIETLYFKQVTGALAVSQQCAEIFAEEFPFINQDIKVFYNYLPLNFYKNFQYDNSLISSDHNYKNIITVCRLDPLKGVEIAIEACKILIEMNKKIKWYVLGDGNARMSIETMIQESGLTQSFFLLGFQLNTMAFIQQCDILVHPSKTEGKSNAVDEAKYAGKAIVVTNYPTVVEQIEHEVTGLICEMTGDDVANAVLKLLNDDYLMKKLSQNCLKHIDNKNNATEYFYNLFVSNDAKRKPYGNKNH